jgi:alpha-1,3-rhamnosyl/mannosyltransferase
VVSNPTVAEDLQRFIGYPRQRIFFAPYPCSEEYARLARQTEPQSAASPFFVSLGTLEPRKNVEQAITALARLNAEPQFADVQLHVIGMRTAHEKQLRLLARKLGLSGKVTFHTDYMPTEQVVAQLLGATALVSMSRYEGFGLPPLEAMSVGCPVILADTPVHRAVYDDAQRRGTGVPPPIVPLGSPEALARAMERMLTDGQWRQAQAQAGKDYAATFTAEACALGLARAFQAVVG